MTKKKNTKEQRTDRRLNKLNSKKRILPVAALVTLVSFYSDYIAKGDINLAEATEECLTPTREGRICILEYVLGLNEEELLSPEDTEKPNILVVLPVGDHTFSIYNSTNLNKIHRYLIDGYDVTIVIAENEQDVYRAIVGNRNRDIEAIVFDTHANGKGIELSPMVTDDGSLDIYDNEFKKYLDLLPENARIIFLGCNSGREGDTYRFEGNNLVDFTARLGTRVDNGIRVTGSMDRTSVDTTRFISLYPLEVAFTDEEGNDTTVHAVCIREYTDSNFTECFRY